MVYEKYVHSIHEGKKKKSLILSIAKQAKVSITMPEHDTSGTYTLSQTQVPQEIRGFRDWQWYQTNPIRIPWHNNE